MSIADSRETDITVYGATSFVAKHVLRYLLEASSDLKLRITLGGRTQSKLDALKSEFASHANGAAIQDVFVASGSDLPGLKKMAERSRVVLNCAGPYALYSSLVVGACAEVGTDYVDFTGEVAWSGEMRQTYGTLAKASGARIISFCGYDAVPSDLAVFAAVEALKEKLARPVSIESAKVWHQMFGLPNGGTVATAVDMPINPIQDFLKKGKEGYSLRKAPFFLGDPLTLAHPEKVRHNPDYDAVKNRLAIGEWLNQLMSVDINFCFGVSLPMPMSCINLKVIQASSVALEYGTKFTARERYVPFGFLMTKVLGIMAFLPMVLYQLSILSVVTVLKLPVVGKKIASLIAPAGSGFPDYLCELGGNAVYATVTAEANDDSGKVDRAYAYISFQGDAGNLVTAQCVSEAALGLVFDRSSLPKRSEDGFGTPAELLGKTLLNRFKETKVRPVEVKTLVRTGTPKNEMKLYIA